MGAQFTAADVVAGSTLGGTGSSRVPACSTALDRQLAKA